MKKFFGITIGGIHQKILNLFIVILAAFVGIYVLISMYQRTTLTGIVEKTRTEQQEAISAISEETMHGALESAMVKINDMQAYISDEMFMTVR